MCVCVGGGGLKGYILHGHVDMKLKVQILENIETLWFVRGRPKGNIQ